MNLIHPFFYLAIFLSSSSLYANEYIGFVTKVIDGDTIYIEEEGVQKKIRLSYIDAPELDQLHGIDSKEFLKSIILNKNVTISSKKKDRYKRELSEIYLFKDSIAVFVNAKMIKSGNAWVYKHYRSNDYLMNLEKHARINKKGLWSSIKPLEPWAHRRIK